jgi:glutamine synthetase
MTEKEGKGYFEDRRPASNMDPYVVCGKIMETCVLPDCGGLMGA